MCARGRNISYPSQARELTDLRKAAANGWHISFALAIEHDVPLNTLPAVGIDRGVAQTLTLSTGEHLFVPASLDALEHRQRRAQKVLARRKRGSTRHAKAKRRVAALSARRARIRKDWHSLDMSKWFGAVVIENLNTRNMTASAETFARYRLTIRRRPVRNVGP